MLLRWLMILETALEARLAGLCLLTCLAVLILGLLILESLTGLMVLYRLAILVLYLLVLCRLAVLILCLLLVPGCLLVLPVITALSLCACGCLPLDYECYMLGKCWTGAYCRYFREAVLPLDPALEAALTTVGPRPDFKPCPICGGAVPVDGRMAYCSEACARIALRRQKREYMRKKRR